MGAEEQEKVIGDLLKRIDILEKEVRSLRKDEAPPSAPPALPPERKIEEEEDRVATAALERLLVRPSALLLPPGTSEFEPSFTYSHSSADRIIIDGVTAFVDLPGLALVLGEVVSERVRRETLITTLTLRTGLTEDTQTELRFPYRYESQRVLRADFQETRDTEYGLGDVELALSHQFAREKGRNPAILGSLRWRLPTGNAEGEIPLGTGFLGIQGLITAVKIRDPVAFFGSLTYTYNVHETKKGVLIDPGESWGFVLGEALALTPDTSVSLSWEQRFTDRAKVAGRKVPGSAVTVGNLRFGFTYAFSRGSSLDIGVVVGLTRDSPDVQATIALPIRFQ